MSGFDHGIPEAAAGGRSHLHRAITGVTNGAITYACAGITAGIFSLFAFSLSASGPEFFWGWLLVGLSLTLACLNYAELASHYPFAASIYHWPRKLAGNRAGWWVGWLYLGALLALLPAYTIVFPSVLSSLFDYTTTTRNIAVVAVGFIIVAALINMLGIEVLGRFTVVGVIAELLILFVLSVLVFLFGPHHSPSVLFHSYGTAPTTHAWLSAFLGGGVFVGLWALFTFETAGTLGEETIDAKRQAPRAILGALWLSVAAGAVFIFLIVLSLPDVGQSMLSATPVQDTIDNALASWVTKVYLVTMVWVLFLATNTLFTAICRHVYGMARDGQLPASSYLSRLTKTGEPWVAAIVVAALTCLPLLLVTQNLTVMVTGAIAAIYVPYVAVLCITLWARTKGWPREHAPFSLGRWGIPINVAAVLFAVASLVNLMWPRDTTNPVWKLDIRVAYWLVGIPLAIGLAYYAGWQHRRLGGERPVAVSDMVPDEAPG